MFVCEHFGESRKITNARFKVVDACADGIHGCRGSFDALAQEVQVVCHLDWDKGSRMDG